jgi:hypothetical protein
MNEALIALQAEFDRTKGSLSPEGVRDMQNRINALKSESSKNTNTPKDNTKSGGDFSISKILLDLYQNSKASTVTPENTDYITNLLSNISNSSGNAVEALATGLVQTTLGGIGDYIKEQSYLLTFVNRELGLAGKLSDDFREAITEAQPEFVRMGIPFKDVTAAVERLIEDTGRFALVGTEMLRRAGEIGSAYGMNMEDIIGAYDDFENVGIGAAQAQESIADVGKRSLDLGIQSRRVIQGLVENIGKLNEFGFKNGSEGLEKMVRRSLEVRSNLQNVFSVAEKVFDPEGALELSANLSALGMAFGDFNDPIRLMYMATNEVEGLQMALEGVSQNLATYNTETGGFEVTGLNLRMARDAAKALGVEVEDINKTAIALAERGQVDMALSGLQITEEDKEFLANISRMKDGKMSVELMTPELQATFGGASVQLDKLSQEGVNQLLEYRESFKELSEGDLVRQQVTLVENISRDVNYLVTLGRLRAAGVGDELLKTITQMDFKDTGKNLSEVLKMNVDELVKEFGNTGSSTVQEIRKLSGIDTAMKQEKEEQERMRKEQSKPKEVVVTQTINHVSDQMMQGIQKEYVLNGEKFRMEGLGYLVPDK